ncbi:MAG TPA: cob(I)yrinic acid a,c-diamide adenosyltransferase [Flavobacteriales bacterium]|jgi:cob(I)alamin adenosyltransferase|nr:cob(I)yrinic acid a,c-diamide adenosyltransferase [Flavobacteriales bacterium]HHZ95426.1 cob(I)yrinic acid a,c-diamide adenosyltransferase [Flavobacteriales bacterium]HIO60109.1 cob(I)yrinic acid a,c-diamide adenosyltransferase [Flavobacteriales bacterium]
MRIYTRTGDDGTTGLFGGARVKKDDLRIEAYGTVDELNAFLGKLIEHEALAPHLDFFRDIQSQLFTLGSHLATIDPEMKAKLPPFDSNAVTAFEKWMDQVDENVPALKNFLLPGGHPSVADAHVARAVCRRAERRCVSLAQVADIDSELIIYLNRLSDLLFTTARHLSNVTGTEEIAWKTR